MPVPHQVQCSVLMKRVLTAVVLIPLVLLAVFRASAPLFAALVAAVAILAAREFVELVRHYNVTPFRMPTYVGVVLMFAALIFYPRQAQIPALATESLFYIVFAAAVFGAFFYLVVGML